MKLLHHPLLRISLTYTSPSITRWRIAPQRGLSWHRQVQGGRAELLGQETAEGRNFVQSCRDEYLSQGWCHIPNFLPDQTVTDMCEEATNLLADDRMAFESSDNHTVYQEEPVVELGTEHPRNIEMVSSKKIVDFARISENSPLKALYNRDELREFVQEVVGVDTLYRSACPFNAAMVNGYFNGHGLGWHFDRSEFGVNLVLQNPSSGGDFEFHHLTRCDNDLFSYDTVDRILKADDGNHNDSRSEKDRNIALKETGVMRVPGIAPGSLVFFAGRLSMHRVTKVVGSQPRINAILTFEKLPGQVANAYSLEKFFGRTVKEQQAAIKGINSQT